MRVQEDEDEELRRKYFGGKKMNNKTKSDMMYTPLSQDLEVVAEASEVQGYP